MAIRLQLTTFAACLVLAHVVSGQTPAAKPDELRFNDNSNNNKPQQQTNGDTTIISDNQQQQQQQQNQRPGPKPLHLQSDVVDLENMPNFYDDNNRQPSLFDSMLAPMPSFGFGPLAPPPPTYQQRPQSLWHTLLGGGPSDLFGRMDRHHRQLERHLERQFADLERSAAEGQDVSYFQRNGVAYVRTCTTKRVTPGGQNQGQDQDQEQEKQPQVLPVDNQPQELQNNNNNNMNQQEGLSSEIPTIPSSSPAPVAN